MSPVQLRYDRPPRPPPAPIVIEPPDRTAELLDALRALALPSAPTVLVEPPDLTDIVTAVTSLKPGPTAAEIAAAIADVLLPARADKENGVALREVAEALRNLDFRMKGFGRQAYGGGQVHLEPGQTIGVNNFPGALLNIAHTQVTVGATQVAIPVANLAGRKTVSVMALGGNAANVYVGLTGVTTSTGWELAAGASIDLDAADSVQLYAIASGSQKVALLEIG